MSRHRGAKTPPSMLNTWAGISLLFPGVTFIFRQRWPFHTESHRSLKTYFRNLARRVCLAVKACFCLYKHSTHDFDHWLSTPSCFLRYFLWRGWTAPQSKLPTTQVSSIQISTWTWASRTSKHTSVVFQDWLQLELASYLSKPPHLSYTIGSKIHCWSYSKGHGVFPSSRWYTASSRVSFHWVSGEGQCAPSLRHSCRSELTRQGNLRLPLRTVISLRPPLLWAYDQRSFSLTLTPSLTFQAPGQRHTLYVTFRVCRVLCFLINSRSHLVLRPTSGLPEPKSFTRPAYLFSRILQRVTILPSSFTRSLQRTWYSLPTKPVSGFGG